MKPFFLVAAGLLLAPGARAGGSLPKYPVAAVPTALRENAHAVVRLHEQTMVVKSVGRTVETIHQVTTILDEAGAKWATEVVYYDQLNGVSYLRGAIYNEAGSLLRQLRPADVHDVSLSDGFSLASSGRARYVDLRQATYPYTVEVEYEVVSNNALFYSSWYPQPAEQLAVEQASFRVLTPTDLPLRYQESHLPNGISLARSKQADLDVYQWDVKNLAAIEEEPDSPPLSEFTPSVRTAPTRFEVEGYTGTLQSWQGLGQWSYDLNARRDALPPELAARIAALVQGEADERARIRKVYEFLQANTRYVSIQLGIGGWQTFPAASVAANGYGDCKALSNYCMALLKAADITAYCALVRADEPDIRTEFPSSQFNHVVLCVPLAHAARPDTVWLECTSQTNPFNYMGSFTGNRHALLVTPTGGQLVRTPRYGAQENQLTRRSDVYLDAAGSATATVYTHRTGLEQETQHGMLHNLSAAEQKKRVGDALPLANFSITKFSLTPDNRTALPAMNETLGLTLPNFATPSGKRLFLTPNLLSRMAALPATVGERQTDIWLEQAFTHADTVRIHVPAGLKPENLPAPVKLATAFGTYSSQVLTLPDGTLQYVRQLTMPRTRFSRTDYPAYLEFRRKVSTADKAQVVLLKTAS